ncbi:MAG TPA: hypothetical protein VNA24_19485 [Hyalangium sp.]|nr:hypothetical protein [Hyalangium sp.]
MRLLALVGLVAVLSGCGVGVEEEAVGADSEVTQQDIRERWCNSYTTQRYCPTNVCYWDSTRNLCTLRPTSVTGEQAEASNWPGEGACTRDSQCDTVCGGPNTGVCSRFICYCRM